jgi:uncharacterized delta-60 repeat protein
MRARFLPPPTRLRLEPLEDRSVPAGILDSTFNGGFAVLPVGFFGASAVAVQPDEKVFLAGTFRSNEPYGDAIGVIRLDAHGHPDPTFPVVAVVDPPGGSSVDDISMALQPDGKIVIAASTHGWEGSIFLARLNADGSPDSSFGNLGQTTFHFGPLTDDRVGGLALQPDGKIVVGGYLNVDTTAFFAVARLNSNGRLDRAFGALGVTVIAHGEADPSEMLGGKVAVQPDGRILLAGTEVTLFTNQSGSTSDPVLVRLGSDGQLDQSFGDGGRMIMDWGSPNDSVGGLAVQPDGRVIVAGKANWGVQAGEFAVARLTPAGALDPSFAFGGINVLGVGPGDDTVTGAAVLPNGEIVLAGNVMNDLRMYEMGAVLLRPDGTPDPAFDYDGRAVVPNYAYSRSSPVPLPGESFAFAGVAATPAGGFVVAGMAPSPAPVGSAGFAAVRFAAPVGAPPSDVTLWHRPVPENSPLGTLVGYLQATDPDVGDPFTFELVDGAADNARFRIQWNMVLTAEVFDYEARAQYIVRVRVTDATGLSLEKDLVVNIGDELESP